MAGASIGPLNLMLRADSTALGRDLDTAGNMMKVKGSLLRINPALNIAGLGIGKPLIKGMMRELPGLLGAQGFGALAGGLGIAAKFLGPIGLAAMLGGAAVRMGKSAADKQTVDAYDQAWEGLHKQIGTLFIPAVKLATQGFATISGALESLGLSKAGEAGAAAAHLMSPDQFADKLTIAAFEATRYEDKHGETYGVGQGLSFTDMAAEGWFRLFAMLGADKPAGWHDEQMQRQIDRGMTQ